MDEIINWEENVRAVYDYLRRDPSIDTERVYLFGASAETVYMSQCLERLLGYGGELFSSTQACCQTSLKRQLFKLGQRF